MRVPCPGGSGDGAGGWYVGALSVFVSGVVSGVLASTGSGGFTGAGGGLLEMLEILMMDILGDRSRPQRVALVANAS